MDTNVSTAGVCRHKQIRPRRLHFSEAHQENEKRPNVPEKAKHYIIPDCLCASEPMIGSTGFLLSRHKYMRLLDMPFKSLKGKAFIEQWIFNKDNQNSHGVSCFQQQCIVYKLAYPLLFL